jgi:hypothetical protein
MIFFIPNNVPSSKNSKRWTGKILISSKITLEYRKNSEYTLNQIKINFKNEIEKRKLSQVLLIGFHFVRKDKRKYDWINPLQTIQDLLVKNELIEDDNVSIMFPLPLAINGEFTSINKEKPGVYFKILNMEDTLINKLIKHRIDTSLSYNSIRIVIENKLDKADNVIDKHEIQELYNEFMEFYINYLDSLTLKTNTILQTI